MGLAEMGGQDWFVLAYHVVLVLAVLVIGQGPEKARSLFDMTALLFWFAGTMVLVRGRFLGPSAEGLLYRFTLVGTMQVSYFMFRRMLPLVNSQSLDEPLYHFDLKWFGVEPAIWVQPYVTPALTEWFSFFYFGYFFLMLVHVLPNVFAAKDKQMQHEFTFAALLSFGIGHLLYMVVPGFGPVVAMKDSFAPFPPGPWFDAMVDTVQTGGAQKDIFPSIHTAIPTMLSLWSFRHRAKVPYRYSWPLVTFFSCNIVLATMYLGWHYLIDVIAGFTLGSISLLIAVYGTSHELGRRERLGLRPVWPNYPLFDRSEETCEHP